MFSKKGVLRNFAQFTGKHLYQSLFFNKVAGLRPQACNFIKKEAPAQVFFCEFCEISWNTFCYRTPPVAASEFLGKKVSRNALALKSRKLQGIFEETLILAFLSPAVFRLQNRISDFF